MLNEILHEASVRCHGRTSNEYRSTFVVIINKRAKRLARTKYNIVSYDNLFRRINYIIAPRPRTVKVKQCPNRYNIHKNYAPLS